MKNFSVWSRSRLEPELEPTQVGRSRSRSRLRDLGDLEPEPEPPKKVAAPQHWYRCVLVLFSTVLKKLKWGPGPVKPRTYQYSVQLLSALY